MHLFFVSCGAFGVAKRYANPFSYQQGSVRSCNCYISHDWAKRTETLFTINAGKESAFFSECQPELLHNELCQTSVYWLIS